MDCGRIAYGWNAWKEKADFKTSKAGSMTHVTPINDQQEHVEESTCHCYPRIVEQDGEMICIHQGFDARELIEQGLQPGAKTNVAARCGKMLVEGDVVETAQGTQFLCLTIMGLRACLRDRQNQLSALESYMSPNLFYVGNLVSDLQLRHDFFHSKN